VAKHGALLTLENCLEQVVGKSVAAKVMVGSKQITEKTDKKKIAQWVKNAMEKLDASVDEKTKAQVMLNCGYNCANKNHRLIERAVARRKKYPSVDAFLVTEQKNPMKGTKLTREGNILYQTYTPQSFTRPMRRYCALFKGLPNEDTISNTYCNCGKGFAEKYWEIVLQKPVKVDLMQSAVTGAKECKFAIHF
jgi:hypothetical protein